MGALKDIYDILSDITAKTKARNLNQSQERSREDLISDNAELVAVIEELKAQVENLNREHAAEVADLTAKNEELVATNEQLVAKVAEIEAPKTPPTINRVGTPKGW